MIQGSQSKGWVADINIGERSCEFDKDISLSYFPKYIFFTIIYVVADSTDRF